MKSLVKITGVLLLCVIVSCRKNQLDEISAKDNSETLVAQQTQNSESGWIVPSQWNTAERPTHTVYYTNITADNITDENADNSLVRIYLKDNAGKMSSKVLPFEENFGSQKFYWYYEVTDGNIMVSVDVYGSKTNPLANNSLKYVVLNNAAIGDMERKGISKKQIMQMSYEDLNKMK